MQFQIMPYGALPLIDELFELQNNQRVIYKNKKASFKS